MVGMVSMKCNMKCVFCGEEAQCVRDNASYIEACEKDFDLKIPVVEIWVCTNCHRGWVYQDNILRHVGRAWHSLESARIPDGALAVLGEE